jgi:hypothetical protein
MEKRGLCFPRRQAFLLRAEEEMNGAAAAFTARPDKK